MNKYLLDEILFPNVFVEENSEYKSFIFKQSKYDMTSFALLNCLHRIKNECNTLYWNCVHVYITGEDKITGEEYSINNHTVDIPYKNVNMDDVINIYRIIFNTLLNEPNTDSDDVYFFNYYNAVKIKYMKIILKRTIFEKKCNLTKHDHIDLETTMELVGE